MLNLIVLLHFIIIIYLYIIKTIFLLSLYTWHVCFFPYLLLVDVRLEIRLKKITINFIDISLTGQSEKKKKTQRKKSEN